MRGLLAEVVAEANRRGICITCRGLKRKKSPAVSARSLPGFTWRSLIEKGPANARTAGMRGRSHSEAFFHHCSRKGESVTANARASLSRFRAGVSEAKSGWPNVKDPGEQSRPFPPGLSTAAEMASFLCGASAIDKRRILVRPVCNYRQCFGANVRVLELI